MALELTNEQLAAVALELNRMAALVGENVSRERIALYIEELLAYTDMTCPRLMKTLQNAKWQIKGFPTLADLQEMMPRSRNQATG